MRSLIAGLLAFGAAAALMGPGPAEGKTPQQLKGEFAAFLGPGRYARMVWQKEADMNSLPNYAAGKPNKLMALDTRDGNIRPLWANQPSGHMSEPSLTWDGRRVVFYNSLSSQVYVCDWEGTDCKVILAGYASSRTWRSQDGKDYVIASNSKDIYRINIDDPADRVKLATASWQASEEDGQYAHWATLSPDGKFFSGAFPLFPDVGMVEVATGKLRKFSPGGCWPTLARDNSYQTLYTIEPHTHVRIVDGNGKETLNKRLPADIVPPGAEYECLRWTPDKDYMTLVTWAGSGSGFANPKLVRISDLKHVSLQERPTSAEGNMDVWFYGEEGVSQGPAAPTFSPAPGAYSDSVAVTLATSSSGAAIRYTLDGSEPGPTSTPYSKPITLKRDATLKAKAVATVNAAAAWSTTSIGVYTLRTGETQAPKVDAGMDFEAKVGQTSARLQGSVKSGSGGAPILLWKQVAGPVPAQILSPATEISQVRFEQEGAYRFELSARDGALTGRDTVAVTALATLPFTILAPLDLGAVPIGKPYSIRWQMDPPLPCRISYSLDNGLTWKVLTLGGAVGGDGNTVYDWNTPKDAADGARGTIKVENYGDAGQYAVRNFVFSASTAPVRRIAGAARGPGPVWARRGTLAVIGLEPIGEARLTVWEADGRVVLRQAAVRDGEVLRGPALRPGALLGWRLEASGRQWNGWLPPASP